MVFKTMEGTAFLSKVVRLTFGGGGGGGSTSTVKGEILTYTKLAFCMGLQKNDVCMSEFSCTRKFYRPENTDQKFSKNCEFLLKKTIFVQTLQNKNL